jgi:hypothetical protein
LEIERKGSAGMDNFNNNATVLDGLRTLDLVSYLDALGYQPAEVKKNRVEYWYLSPLRSENTASFKINRLKNIWFDFQMHKGGNFVDFCLEYYQCTIPELIDKFTVHSSLHQRPLVHAEINEGLAETENKIAITKVEPLYAYLLKSYLLERLIPASIAEKYCCQVAYEMNSRPLYGIGFKNDSGGYEIRNQIMKHSSSPKDVTTVRNGASEVQIFEGFVDFLSYRTLHQDELENQFDFVILNGAGMFEKARPFMEQHQAAGLWLDNDTTGSEYTKYALCLNKSYVDKSSLYEKYKDLNDFLTGKLAKPKQQVRQKIT